MTPVIQAVATANPPRYETQETIFRILQSQFALEPAEKNLYERLMVEGRIRGRYLAFPRNEDALETNLDVLTQRFCTFGRQIAAQAAREALAGAGLSPADVGGLVVNTCTGYLCPGLSSYLAEDLGLDPFVKATDLMGMGCGAAVPNLECAAGLLARGAARTVLSVAVEICSATMFMGPQPDLIVSNSLFGDGAAAVVMTSDGDDARGRVRVLDFESGLFPRYREDLRYRTEDRRLRNVLSRQVPAIGAWSTGEVARRLLERHGLAIGDIAWWIVHPGGTAVLEQVEKRLGLAPEQLSYSYDVLRDYGNMSSPSVLFILDRVLREGRPRPGERGLMVAFGAGFSAYAALLQF